MRVLGLGLDLVDLEGFGHQLADEASGFVAATFTAGELAGVAALGERRRASLGARFAAKEALVKAWSSARRGRPPALASVDLRQVEVVLDGWGRPALVLHGEVARAVAGLLATDEHLDLQVSLSHDGPVAGAVVHLTAIKHA